ncbi:MAG TPA: hypothetical protein ENI19_01615 [Candidatus Nealsonbacteria bacterium]|nr:hypothetical protein [Candidatus Nealsonbacteria bacterium]HEB46391.1 hypothetical protein [Candidatus Nealsonbacteria bacterium]
MKAIKEFLKPNWGKVGIFIAIIVLVYVMISQFEFGITLLFASDNCGRLNCPPPFVQEVKFNPLIFPFANFLHRVEESLSSPINLLGIFIVLLYYYLLACLIYFIIKKIKRLIVK